MHRSTRMARKTCISSDAGCAACPLIHWLNVELERRGMASHFSQTLCTKKPQLDVTPAAKLTHLSSLDKRMTMVAPMGICQQVHVGVITLTRQSMHDPSGRAAPEQTRPCADTYFEMVLQQRTARRRTPN